MICILYICTTGSNSFFLTLLNSVFGKVSRIYAIYPPFRCTSPYIENLGVRNEPEEREFSSIACMISEFKLYRVRFLSLIAKTKPHLHIKKRASEEGSTTTPYTHDGLGFGHTQKNKKNAEEKMFEIR